MTERPEPTEVAAFARRPAAPVTIALGGDTMLGRLVGAALRSRRPETVWTPELLEVFHEADVAIVNLECCISERGEPWEPGRKPFHFRAPPRAVDALVAAGVRAVWLANNHALDFGPVALLDTFEHLQGAGIAWAGASSDLETARRGTTIRIGEVTIGLVGFADHPADFAARPDSPGIAFAALESGRPPEWLLGEVRSLASRCHVVIAGAHWGPNMNPSPLPHHPSVARALAEAGADALAGHSAHVFQPVEVVSDAAICYDLGDLLDDYQVDPVLRNDLGVLALLRPRERLQLVPLKLEFTQTTLAQGDDHTWVVERVVEGCRRRGTDVRVEGDRLSIPLARPAQTGPPPGRPAGDDS
jgi:poly-gamma-glutamate capsule biosynthesis protein CapA/YwtB (metallophosphatase superfamily)